ncbi:MAG: hypothetical protein DLM62_18245 [Pseudonocardiales bacterium]|nr:MAG: hypothetical protein DLM62_18245 [Pseudonocardiales bacterium]
MNRFAVLRAGYGALLLAAPDPVIRLYTGHRADQLTRAVTRVLGGRQLVQGILTAGTPGALVLALGAEVDLAHVASMLGLAVLDQQRRRAGLVDAAAAGAFAIAGAILACRAPMQPEPTADACTRRLAVRQTAATWIARRTLPAPIRQWLQDRRVT